MVKIKGYKGKIKEHCKEKSRKKQTGKTTILPSL
jgi:hypothetical protein